MTRTATLLLGIALLGACADPAPTTVATNLRPQAAPSLEKTGVGDNKDLAALRAATAGFHRFEVAKSAGYTFLFMNMCMVDQSSLQLGGMGYHYVNTELLDASVDVEHPEALLYEPGSNGQLNLVAVEYVIPKAAWTQTDPPRLFGRDFKLNAFDLWALHVWVWENNPSGLYADWNPRVSCANAQTLPTASH
jgi:hypothetical protein